MVTTYTGLGSGGVPQDKRRYGGRVFVDNNRRDTYTPDGSLEKPYRTVSSAEIAKALLEAEDIQLVLTSDPGAMGAVPVLQLESGVYDEVVDVDSAVAIQGNNQFFTKVKTIQGSSGTPVLILENLKIENLIVSVPAAYVIRNCEITTITITAAPLVFMMVNCTVDTATIIPGSQCIISRSKITTEFNVNLTEGDSGLILAEYSGMPAPTVTQANDEELVWALNFSNVDDGWVAQDFESIYNVASCLGNLDKSGAAAYSLTTAGPAEV